MGGVSKEKEQARVPNSENIVSVARGSNKRGIFLPSPLVGEGSGVRGIWIPEWDTPHHNPLPPGERE
jgi:hypothetical protein